MKTENRKYKCDGCGLSRPCYVETNQEPNKLSIIEDDLKCILDDTNQSFNWNEITISDDVIDTAISSAISILNISDDEIVAEIAANIADTLISITDVKDL